jgi:uncharacterized protein YacL
MHINLANFFTIQSCFIGNRTDNIAWFCTVIFTYFKLSIAPVKDNEVPRQSKDSRRSGEKSDKKPRRKPRKSKFS